MIKILPIKNTENSYNPYFYLNIGIGYGEHCDDNFTEHKIVIDDYKATGAHLDEDGLDENGFPDYETYITEKEAEEIVKFFDNILDVRKNKNGHIVHHLVLNDGPSEFWHVEEGGMTKKEFAYFNKFYEKFESKLYPEVEYNWYGIVWVSIKYFDENGQIHNCEVI